MSTPATEKPAGIDVAARAVEAELRHLATEAVGLADRIDYLLQAPEQNRQLILRSMRTAQRMFAKD